LAFPDNGTKNRTQIPGGIRCGGVARLGAGVVTGVAAGATVVGELGEAGEGREGTGVCGGAMEIVSAADVEIVVPPGGTEVRDTETETAVVRIVPSD
jgi:hypothetical protein